MSYMKQSLCDEGDAFDQWQLEVEERAYSEWCALLDADPGYLVWLESLNHQGNEDYETPRNANQ